MRPAAALLSPRTLPARPSSHRQERSALRHGYRGRPLLDHVRQIEWTPRCHKRLENYVREGDVLVVRKLDRLARSVSHLVAIGGRLEAKQVALKVLDQAIDTSNCTGRLMFNMLGAIAQFEREFMLERQREGIAKAKAEGKYKGRARQHEQRRRRFDVCVPKALDQREIARRLRVSRASVYRALNTSA